MLNIVEDINLDRVVIEKDGKTVRLEFIDMQQGIPTGILECKNVVLLNYHNTMDDDGLAIYVGEVRIEEFLDDEARQKLSSLGFKFWDATGRITLPASGKLYHIHAEGGQIFMDICCEDYRFARV